MASKVFSRLRELSLQLMSYDDLPEGDGRSTLSSLPNEDGLYLMKDEDQGRSLIKATSSTLATISNAINVLMGVGLLSLPYALRESGWCGLFILAACAMITVYTAITLTKCCDTNQGILTYSDIGYHAFGKPGRWCIGGLFYLELFVACTMFLIVAGDNFNVFVPQHWHKWYYIVAGAMMLPSVWVSDLSLLANLSWLGILASAVLLVLILVMGLDPDTPHTPGNLNHPAGTSFLRYETFPLCLGLIMVGFVAHPVFPTLYRSMKKPEHFPFALQITYVAVVIFYAAIAVCGYLVWGDQVKQEVTLNLGSKGLGTVGVALFVLLPFTKYGLTMQPVALSVDSVMATYLDSRSAKFVTFRFLFRTLLVMFTILLAIVVPNFTTPLAICGSLCSFTSSVTFPCLCYLKLCGPQIGIIERCVNYFLVAFGVTGAVCGTVAVLIINSNTGFTHAYT